MTTESTSSAAPERRRRRFVPLVWGSSLVAMALLALGVGSTLSGFSASITNSKNTAGSGTLVMEEDGPGSTVCLSSAAGTVTATNSGTCSTINKFGGNTAMVPGTPVTTSITIKNNGTSPANTFTLTPGACTQSANGAVNGTATDFCSKLDVTITSGSTTIFTGTAASLAAGGVINLPAPVAAGASVPFTFTVTLDPSADNSYQGLAASEPLTWQFAS
jgi:hypothetical protein